MRTFVLPHRSSRHSEFVAVPPPRILITLARPFAAPATTPRGCGSGHMHLRWAGIACVHPPGPPLHKLIT